MAEDLFVDDLLQPCLDCLRVLDVGIFQWVLGILGVDLPQAHPGRLYDLSDAHRATSESLYEHRMALEPLGQPIVEAWGGDGAATMFQQNYAGLLGEMDDTAQAFSQLADLLGNAGLEVDTTLYMSAVALFTLVSIVYAAVCTVIATAGLSLVGVPAGQATFWSTVRELAARLVARLFGSKFVGALPDVAKYLGERELASAGEAGTAALGRAGERAAVDALADGGAGDAGGVVADDLAGDDVVGATVEGLGGAKLPVKWIGDRLASRMAAREAADEAGAAFGKQGLRRIVGEAIEKGSLGKAVGDNAARAIAKKVVYQRAYEQSLERLSGEGLGTVLKEVGRRAARQTVPAMRRNAVGYVLMQEGTQLGVWGVERAEGMHPSLDLKQVFEGSVSALFTGVVAGPLEVIVGRNLIGGPAAMVGGTAAVDGVKQILGVRNIQWGSDLAGAAAWGTLSSVHHTPVLGGRNIAELAERRFGGDGELLPVGEELESEPLGGDLQAAGGEALGDLAVGWTLPVRGEGSAGALVGDPEALESQGVREALTASGPVSRAGEGSSIVDGGREGDRGAGSANGGDSRGVENGDPARKPRNPGGTSPDGPTPVTGQRGDGDVPVGSGSTPPVDGPGSEPVVPKKSPESPELAELAESSGLVESSGPDAGAPGSPGSAVAAQPDAESAWVDDLSGLLPSQLPSPELPPLSGSTHAALSEEDNADLTLIFPPQPPSPALPLLSGSTHAALSKADNAESKIPFPGAVEAATGEIGGESWIPIPHSWGTAPWEAGGEWQVPFPGSGDAEAAAKAPFGFEEFFKHPAWAADVREFEQQLGAYCFNDPDTVSIVRVALRRMRDVIMAMTARPGEDPASVARRVDAAFFRATVHAWADPGQAGPGVTFDDLLEHGNLRELMTAFYNAAYYNRESPHTLSRVILDVIDSQRWEQAADSGMNVGEITDIRNHLDGSIVRRILGIFSVRFDRDPFATGVTTARSDKPIRNLAEMVISQWTRRVRSQADQVDRLNTLAHYRRVGTPLGRFERAFVESLVNGPLEDDTRLPWREGAVLHSEADGRWARNAGRGGHQVIDGVSGSTARMLAAVKVLGFDHEQQVRFLNALMGWMLPTRDHSLYEILRGGEIAGIGSDRPRSGSTAVNVQRGLPGIDIRLLRERVTRHGLLPHEYQYLNNATGIDGFLEQPDHRLMRAIEMLRQLRTGQVSDRDLSVWLRNNGIDPKNSAQVVELGSRMSEAHVAALSLYTKEAHYMINNALAVRTFTRIMGDRPYRMIMGKRVKGWAVAWLNQVVEGEQELRQVPEAVLKVLGGDSAWKWIDASKLMKKHNERARTLLERGMPGEARKVLVQAKKARQERDAAWKELKEPLDEAAANVTAEMRWHADMAHEALMQLPAVGSPEKPVIAYRGDWINAGYSPIYGSKLIPRGTTVALTSLSRRLEIASQFLDHSPGPGRKVLVAYRLIGRSARDISPFSALPQEEELNVPPGAPMHRVEDPALVNEIRKRLKGTLSYYKENEYDIIVMEEG